MWVVTFLREFFSSRFPELGKRRAANPLTLYFVITCICTEYEKLRKDVTDYKSELKNSAYLCAWKFRDLNFELYVLNFQVFKFFNFFKVKFQILVFGFKILIFGFLILAFGSKILIFAFWILIFGFKILFFKFWILNLAFRTSNKIFPLLNFQRCRKRLTLSFRLWLVLKTHFSR